MKMMVSRKTRVALSGALLLLCISLFVFQERAANNGDESKTKRMEVSQLIADWLLTTKEPRTAMSSMPGSYMNNDAFNKITSLDIHYIPYLLEWVEKDESLTSYVMTNAVVRISKVKTKFNYARSHEWLNQWNDYVKNIVPFTYTTVKSRKAGTPGLVEQVTDLGAPVIPYIIEDIKSGDLTYAPALAAIINDSDLPKVDDKEAWRKWALDNEDKYALLKSI